MGRIARRQSVEQDKLERPLRASFENLHKKLKSVIPVKEKVNDSLAILQKLIDRNKLSIGCKLSGSVRSKVLTLYRNALDASREEECLLRQMLSQIDELFRLKFEIHRGGPMGRGDLMQLLSRNARIVPLWIGPIDTHPPPLVGAIPLPVTFTLKVGAEVAAYVDGIWMLAEVVASYNGGKYVVSDVDEEQKGKHLVRRSRLIPLPKWRADPSRDSHALFPLNSIVLALYPQTTCFYKGVVDHVPETTVDDYLIAFEDSAFTEGYSPPLPVSQRFVLTYKVPRTYKFRSKMHSYN